MEWKQKRSYMHPFKKQQRKERRKDIQKSNKRKGQGFGEGRLSDASWDNWDGYGEWVQEGIGRGGISSSSSWVWRSINR
jgi:hypothetical protein